MIRGFRFLFFLLMLAAVSKAAAQTDSPTQPPAQPAAPPSPEAPTEVLSPEPTAGETAGENAESQPPIAPEVVEEVDEDDGISKYMQYLREYSYEPDGRRDPFEEWTETQQQTIEQRRAPIRQRKTAITALERWSLDELQLTGIIWGVTKPKAMIKDPSGKVHIVGKDTKVGFNEGYIAVIREGEIVVVEPFETEEGVSYQTKVIRISR